MAPLRSFVVLAVSIVVSMGCTSASSAPTPNGAETEDGGTGGLGGADAGVETVTGSSGITADGCDPFRCDGCCDAAGRCVRPAEQRVDQCGAAPGSTCIACAENETCRPGHGCAQTTRACSVRDLASGAIEDTCAESLSCVCDTDDGRCEQSGACLPLHLGGGLTSPFGIRLRVVSAHASTYREDGECWDVDCSPPDLYVRVRVSPRGFGTFRDETVGSTPVVDDAEDARWSPPAPFLVGVDYRTPFYVELFDEDVGPDDLVTRCEPGLVTSVTGPAVYVHEHLLRCADAHGNDMRVEVFHE